MYLKQCPNQRNSWGGGGQEGRERVVKENEKVLAMEVKRLEQEWFHTVSMKFPRLSRAKE